MNESLQSRLYSRLEKSPEGRAVTFYNADGNFSWHTFEQFYGRAAATGVRLAENGLGRGDICLIVLPSNELSATLVLATLLLGAVPLLVAPPILQGEAAHSSLKRILDHVIDRSQPRIVICPESMRSMHGSLQRPGSATRYLFGDAQITATDSTLIPPVMPAETATAGMQLTSGTTGFPRICVWKQTNVLAALDGMTAAMQLNEDDLCLNWTPLYHDMGLVNNFLLCLTRGIPLVMLSPHDFVRKPALWLRALADTGTTFTWSPNFGFAITAQRVRDSDIQDIRLDGVRAFWNAAERIHYESMCAFYERFSPYGVKFEALKTNFGCAENVGGATFSDPAGAFTVEHLDRAIFQEESIARPVTDPLDNRNSMTVVGVGKAYPGMNITILSEDGQPLPDGHIGEIALETPSRMEGYLGNPEATDQALHNGLLHTGDQGYLRNGELFWVGRIRERLTIRGKKMDPSDFEPVLFNIPGLRTGNFAAFGVDESQQGTQRIVIVAEVQDPALADSEAITGDIRNRVLEHLSVSVSEVILVPPNTLTKTSSGKRRHRYFRQLYLNGGLADFQI